MKKLISISILICAISSTNSQPPNWASDIAPILYKHCTGCHHSGGIAPFSLITYQDAKAEANGIKRETGSGAMPPWPADPSYSRFAHERLLSMDEINKISNWVNNGTPMGNPADAPAPPVYNNVSGLPNPDLSIRIPDYTSAAVTSDEYRCFAIPTNVNLTKFLSSIEVIPGNTEIVHHVLIFVDKSGDCLALDVADPKPGYPNFGGVGSLNARLIGAWVPGSGIITLPEGFGFKMDAGSAIVLQVHYPMGSQGKKDSTRINVKYATGSGTREVFLASPLSHTTSSLKNGPLFIPKNTIRTFYQEFQVPLDFTVFNIAPHMHLIGESIESHAVLPDQSVLPFIRINHWDFHWQGQYTFPYALKIPAGTVLHAKAVYNNTASNHHNPNNPPKDVSAGEATTDEMMLVFFAYAIYQSGDENILLDSGLLSVPDMEIYHNNLVSIYPNPSSTDVQLLTDGLNGMIDIEIRDICGQLYFSTNLDSAYPELFKFDISDYPAGVYFISVSDGLLRKQLKLIKTD